MDADTGFYAGFTHDELIQTATALNDALRRTRAELDALHHVTDDRVRELDAARAEVAALRTVADAVKTALTEGYPLHPDVRKAYGAIVDRRLTEIERNDNPRR